MPSFPGDRHFRARHPESVFSGESGGCKHLVIRIDVHVILFRSVIKIAQSGCNWIGMVYDIHAVIDDIAGMRDELASVHKLVVRTGTEAITHAAVKAGQAGSSFDRGGQGLTLRVRYRAHRNN